MKLKGLMRLIVFILMILFINAHAQIVTQQNILQGIVIEDPDALKMNEIIFDRVIYDDNVYSTSKKTELGDQARVDMAFRYHTDVMTFIRFRYSTDPSEERENNKTSRFELIFSKQVNRMTFQLDLEMLTNDVANDGDSSGSSIGLDLDSDDTFVNYALDKFLITFYPFNFRSDVGDEFNTLDVTRINTILGSPDPINSTATADERIVTKTIPGIEIQYMLGPTSIYAGAGVATYLYPTNGDFDIEDNRNADSWERKETVAYKAGALYLNDGDKINLQYVTHQNTKETGALLKSAASLNAFKNMGSFIVEFETTASQAGDAPYNIDRDTNWFVNQVPFRAVFSDKSGNEQDWVGEIGHAYSLKIGKNFEDFTPYIDLKYQDQYFIFQGRESAHLLRNKQEDRSHGGLQRYAIGAYLYYDNFYFNTQIEHQIAQNPVFTNSTDLRDDRELSTFEKENTLLTLNIVFTFDGSNRNQTWWF